MMREKRKAAQFRRVFPGGEKTINNPPDLLPGYKVEAINVQPIVHIRNERFMATQPAAKDVPGGN
jgi:hypothetical protein